MAKLPANAPARTRKRKADERERMQRLKLQRREYKLHVDDVAQVDAYVERLQRARERAA